MKNIRVLSAAGLKVCAVLILSMFPFIADAEVGGIVDDGDPVLSPYILFGITEDPEPALGVWTVYHGGDPRYSILNPNGDANGDGMASMVVNEISETAMVAWSRNSTEGFDVVLSYLAGGAWSDPQVLAGDIAVDELDPHLSVDPFDGTVHLFYWVDGPDPFVMHRQAPADLSSWSDPEQVSAQDESACRPAGVIHEGLLYVAYEVHDYGYQGTPRQVILSRKTASGFEPEVVAITHEEDEVRPEVHSHTGNLWVDWIDSAGEMAWTRKDPQSGWDPIAYEEYESFEDREFNARNRIRMQVIQ